MAYVPPCAACKLLRRKCTQECIFAPFFPQDQLDKFKCVHRVFGTSNTAKLLTELPFNQRGDAVISLVYEAASRLQDPVHGPVGLISTLEHKLKQVQDELENSRKELATYVGPQAMLPIFRPPQPQFMSPPSQSQQPFQASVLPQHHHNLVPSGQSYHQQQQIFEAQQLAAVNALAREQQNEMFKAHGEGSSTAVTEMPLGDNFAVYMDEQLQHHHQHQHHEDEAQLFIPPQSQRPSSSLASDLVPSEQSYHQQQQQQIFEAQQLAAVNILAGEQHNEMFRAHGDGSSTAVTKIPLGDNFAVSPSTNNSYYMDQQLQHHHQHQHHEAQLFIPPQSQRPSSSLASDLVPSGQSYHQQQHQHHEAQQLQHHQQQHQEDQQFHHQHQYHDAQLFIPTQSSQPLPLQTQETQTQTQPN